MPLPEYGVIWPPEDLEPIAAAMAVHDAWYAGDPNRLSSVYGAHFRDSRRPAVRSGQFAGGLVGLVSRWFWGTPTPAEELRTKLHVPIASDIAATSADLLFSEPPTFEVDSSGTQDRLDEIAQLDLWDATLLEAAEVSAALSGVFLRVAWDQDFAPHPMLTAVHPDIAVPEFRWGRLSAVTFWTKVTDDGGEECRHLERHEPGRILHGLYAGGAGKLGIPLPLTDSPATAPYAPLVDSAGAIRTDFLPDGRLTVVYVPNIRPQREFRSHPVGAYLGRSDLAGIEGLMDALDEVYTSWLRDVRLAKARLVVPESYLEGLGRGQGARFDTDREVFSPLALLDRPGDKATIEAVQFGIRVEEHSRTCAELISRIVEGAGYSAQTFGAAGDVAITATEVHARERRSFITRDKKSRYWRAALAEIVETLLLVDAAVFGSGVDAERPSITFGDTVQEQPLVVAQTAAALRTAEAASTDTLVRMVHPDWDDADVAAEVQLIEDQAAARAPVLADPTEIGGDPAADPTAPDAGPPPDPAQPPA